MYIHITSWGVFPFGNNDLKCCFASVCGRTKIPENVTLKIDNLPKYNFNFLRYNYIPEIGHLPFSNRA